MKKSTILEVFQRDRGMSPNIPMSDEYFKLIAKVCDLEKEFMKKIEAEPDLTKQLHELENAIDAASSVEIDNYFVEGFKIGLLIGIEASEPYEPSGL